MPVIDVSSQWEDVDKIAQRQDKMRAYSVSESVRTTMDMGI